MFAPLACMHSIERVTYRLRAESVDDERCKLSCLVVSCIQQGTAQPGEHGQEQGQRRAADIDGAHCTLACAPPRVPLVASSLSITSRF